MLNQTHTHIYIYMAYIHRRNQCNSRLEKSTYTFTMFHIFSIFYITFLKSEVITKESKSPCDISLSLGQKRDMLHVKNCCSNKLCNMPVNGRATTELVILPDFNKDITRLIGWLLSA